MVWIGNVPEAYVLKAWPTSIQRSLDQEGSNFINGLTQNSQTAGWWDECHSRVDLVLSPVTTSLSLSLPPVHHDSAWPCTVLEGMEPSDHGLKAFSL
jgi:hypothetical protein